MWFTNVEHFLKFLQTAHFVNTLIVDLQVLKLEALSTQHFISAHSSASEIAVCSGVTGIHPFSVFT